MTVIAGGHGEPNPNSSWLGARGMWLAYLIGVLAVHLILLSVPFITIPMAWTLTNLMHNAAHLYFLHMIKGAPWFSIDNEAGRRLTHWEQIDDGEQFTATRKFLTAVPILLFLLCCLYTRNDTDHFIANFISLVVVTLPKLPQFHGADSLRRFIRANRKFVCKTKLSVIHTNVLAVRMNRLTESGRKIKVVDFINILN